MGEADDDVPSGADAVFLLRPDGYVDLVADHADVPDLMLIRGVRYR
ncbi:hypothetical protein [Kineosporia sp. NBRC 101731]|nr:hypothetical protein [Kineosporia sp. NBRC 101731]